MMMAQIIEVEVLLHTMIDLQSWQSHRASKRSWQS